MITRFTGAKFFQAKNLGFSDELLVSEGKVVQSDRFDNEINLGGGFVFPAFRDGHAHPLFAGREADGPVVTGASSIQQVQEILASYRNSNPTAPWVEGGAYDRSLVPDGRFLASWIDEVISDVPVVLHASDHHTIWVNSKALELIPRPIPTVRSGSIDLDEAMSPLGVLREPDAMALVLDKAPKRTLEQDVEALVWADRQLAAFGIVEAQDAWITPGMTEVYLEAITLRKLLLDYNLAFKIEPANFSESIEFALSDRNKVNSLASQQLTANTVKFFADGVFGSGTASVLEPYLDGSGSTGEPLWAEEELLKATFQAAKSGFQLHIHAIGDAGVRQALDAIAATQQELGKPKLPSVIAHAELIHEADVKRFAELGVIANMQPLWAQADGMLLSCQARLGEARLNEMYRMRDLLGSGATIAFGSDWPVSSANPILGVATAVTRQTEDGEPKDGWVAEQAMTVSEALRAYSSNVELQLRNQVTTGLGVGEAADFILLSDNPLSVAKENLRSIQVTKTFKSGLQIF